MAKSEPAATNSRRFQAQWPQLRVDQVISGIFLILVLLLQASYQPVAVTEQVQALGQTGINSPVEIDLSDVAFVPFTTTSLADQADFLATVSAEAVYVSDESSGAVLLQKNSAAAIAPASTTKLMTALVARNRYQLDDIVTVRQEAFTEGNTMGLQIGEQITVQNLLYGLLISSGNDAAFALANHHPLGYDGFIAEMNVLADQLYLDQTSFQNPSGLDQDQHQTTARDLTILAREVMKDPLLRSIVGTQLDVVSDISGQSKHSLYNTHALLGVEPGVVGIKTGTTFQAGQALVTQVEKNDQPIIITVLRSQDRYADTRQIINWITTHYSWVRPELVLNVQDQQ